MNKDGMIRTVIYSSGSKEWHVDGELVGIQKTSGHTEWYKEGKLHCEDGPAMIYPSGHQEWYREGKLHREAGPAVIRTSGSEDWYVDGKEVEPPKKEKVNTVSVEDIPKVKIEKPVGETIKNKIFKIRDMLSSSFKSHNDNKPK
jgi:hypothetical protein